MRLAAGSLLDYNLRSDCLKENPMSEMVRLATIGDCRVLAYHAYLAGQSHLDRSIYDLMFGGPPGPTDERLSLLENLLQTRTVSWCHYTFSSVVTVDGQVAASLLHYHNRDGAYNNIGPALMEMGWEKEELLAMVRRLQPLFEVDFPRTSNSVFIENVAVSPKFRRRGFVSRLLEQSASQARNGGFDDLQLGVLIGNTPAQCAYENAGFEVVGEKRDAAFEELMGSPGMYQMRMEL